jgi:hypothetical protein
VRAARGRERARTAFRTRSRRELRRRVVLRPSCPYRRGRARSKLRR